MSLTKLLEHKSTQQLQVVGPSVSLMRVHNNMHVIFAVGPSVSLIERPCKNWNTIYQL